MPVAHASVCVRVQCGLCDYAPSVYESLEKEVEYGLKRSHGQTKRKKKIMRKTRHCVSGNAKYRHWTFDSQLLHVAWIPDSARYENCVETVQKAAKRKTAVYKQKLNKRERAEEGQKGEGAL